MPALVRLAQRYPLVSLSNGNADLGAGGSGRSFQGGSECGAVWVWQAGCADIPIAADVAGVRPDEVLHVGDDASTDVLGAWARACRLCGSTVPRRCGLYDHVHPHDTVSQLNEASGRLS